MEQLIAEWYCVFLQKIAPVKLAVLPLTKKDGLPELARGIDGWNANLFSIVL